MANSVIDRKLLLVKYWFSMDVEIKYDYIWQREMIIGMKIVHLLQSLLIKSFALFLFQLFFISFLPDHISTFLTLSVTVQLQTQLVIQYSFFYTKFPMLPSRKISKGFRERKIPNIATDSNFDSYYGNENVVPNLFATQMIINPDRFNQDLKKEKEKNLFMLTRKKSKDGLRKITNPDLLDLVRKKIGAGGVRQNSFKMAEKQAIVQTRGPKNKSKTVHTQESSLEKTLTTDSNPVNYKTKLADKILQQIEHSMLTTKRSMSVMGKQKSKKKRLIEQCKVKRIPWKSAKNEFRPEVSMIEKNISKVPMDSLREIYDNLN